MKKITNLGIYNVDGKDIVIVSGDYNGSPMMCYKYDVLIGKKEIIDRYYHDLVPEHQLKQGWMPKIQYI